MNRAELYNKRKKLFSTIEYEFKYYKDFNFGILNNIMYIMKPGRNGYSVSDCIIMLDTETSKKKNEVDYIAENHLVAFSISVRAFDKNICTLYGHKPSECVECLQMLLDALAGDKIFVYIFNASYDYIFLRKFLFRNFGYPIKQLNTKSHYPIYIEFENGLVIRDALCLAQRKLERWAADMGVEHQKAVGSWDYDIIRNQDWNFSNEELKYIENDTLAGVECIDLLKHTLNKKLYNMPWTATGIPRDEVKKRGKENNGNRFFKKQVLDYQQQLTMQKVFHGGYTHGNRLYYGRIINEEEYGTISCYDFSSSYPYCLCSQRYPVGKFTPMKNRSMYDILKDKDNNAYYFKFIMIGVELKDRYFPMPVLQFSKCVKTINAEVDNGRILSCDYAEAYITEADLEILENQYNFKNHVCTEVYSAHKDYLPRWFTDYVFDLFRDKTKLKGGDRVLYALKKATLNSVYGMTVQKPIANNIVENYETGEFSVDESNPEEEYEKFKNRRSNVYNFQIGVWTTAYACRNLFKLGECAGLWLYSDTDSCYGCDWDLKKLKTYNDSCKQQLKNNGYGGVKHNGKIYWLGVAEFDGAYSEFVEIHSKCYCGRSKEDGQLHITVAGVPKNGVKVLKDDITNFRDGLIFSGGVTGKKTYTYFFSDDIHIDENGNEVGDSVDMSPCDYLLSSVYTWEQLITNDIEVQVYG